MKKVGIIGASGMAGSAIYKLAEKNPNIDVVGIVRHEKKIFLICLTACWNTSM